MVSTIPASDIVSVTPSVLATGGTAVDLIGLFLDNSPRVPIGQVLAFASQASVSAYFGPGSAEATYATVYFAGFDASTKKPGSMLFAQYNPANVGAWIRGGSLAAMTLAQLQAVTGALNVTIDGSPQTIASVSIGSVTSFADAANKLGKAMGIHGVQAAAVTGAISATTLTVSAVGSGTIAVGDVVTGAGVTAGTYITALGTGTGGTGTYTVSDSQSVGSEALTLYAAGITFDTVSSAFEIWSGTTGSASTIAAASGAAATSLNLTTATGAVTSQGANTAVPATFMTGILAITTNWATFTTTFDPDSPSSWGGGANTLKLAFAAWVNGQNNRYAYVACDGDASPTTSPSATGSLGYILKGLNSSGTIPVNEPTDLYHGPFIMGAIASIDFGATGGRSTLDFKGQSGLQGGLALSPAVSTQTAATNLRANGYNFYGSWGAAVSSFNFFNPGSVTGLFAWIDSYVNQIWLNARFQLDLFELLTTVKSVPYNDTGYAMIASAMQDGINSGLNFGAFRAGVPLSGSQIAAVNAAAGKKIDDVLSSRGWYLLINAAAPSVRVARGSPSITFFYMDGESVQQINVASVEAQ